MASSRGGGDTSFGSTDSDNALLAAASQYDEMHDDQVYVCVYLFKVAWFIQVLCNDT